MNTDQKEMIAGVLKLQPVNPVRQSFNEGGGNRPPNEGSGLDLTEEWSARNARVMVGLCAESYSLREGQGETIECGLMHSPREGQGERIQCGLTHGVVKSWREEDGSCTKVMAIRGTANAADWRRDLNIKRVPVDSLREGQGETNISTEGNEGNEDGPKVHRGFLEAAEEILPLVSAEAETAAQFFLTGHSLGGAVAVLLAWKLAQRGLNVRAVYTFGGPRVGDWRFRLEYERALGRRTFRVVNQADIVPRVPLWLLGWRHVGRELFLPLMGRARWGTPIWLKLLSDFGAIYREWAEGRIALVADHDCAREYVRRMNEL